MRLNTNRIKLMLLFENGKRCAICGRKIKTLDDLTVDHIIPVSRGGKNVLANYQLAHKRCNENKGCLMPDEFIEQLKSNRRRVILMRIRKWILVW